MGTRSLRVPTRFALLSKARKRRVLQRGLHLAEDARGGADGKAVGNHKKVVVRYLRLLAVDGELMASAVG